MPKQFIHTLVFMLWTQSPHLAAVIIASSSVGKRVVKSASCGREIENVLHCRNSSFLKEELHERSDFKTPESGQLAEPLDFDLTLNGFSSSGAHNNFEYFD